jgi:polyphosphate kinase 2
MTLDETPTTEAPEIAEAPAVQETPPSSEIPAPPEAEIAGHNGNGSDPAPAEATPVVEIAEPRSLYDSVEVDEAALRAKAERKAKKKEKKKAKKSKTMDMKEHWGDAKATASSFPMVELIAEQVRTSIPPELVARVEAAKNKKKKIISPNFPYEKTMKSEDYNEEVKLLQIELVKMQAWVKETGERIVMLFEGRDAAGKGGTIQRFTENLNPRGARVVALTKPSETERGQWYFQRYVEQLPTKGEIVFFDRSWYNRAGVEHVMGFCSPHDYLEFMRQAPEFERMLVRSGIRFFKFWFSVSREEQLRRFLGRAQDPLKQWKLSPMDVESLGRWEAYTKAKEAMLFYTDTADAPWTIVRSCDKNRARLNAMRHILSSIPYAGKGNFVKSPDPHIVGSAKTIYEHGENGKVHAV